MVLFCENFGGIAVLWLDAGWQSILAILAAASCFGSTGSTIAATVEKPRPDLDVVTCRVVENGDLAYSVNEKSVGRNDDGVAKVNKTIQASTHTTVLLFLDRKLDNAAATRQAELFKESCRGKRLLTAQLPDERVVTVVHVREPRGVFVLEMHGRIVTDEEAVKEFKDTARHGGIVIEVYEIPRDAGGRFQGRAVWERELSKLIESKRVRYEHIDY